MSRTKVDGHYSGYPGQASRTWSVQATMVLFTQHLALKCVKKNNVTEKKYPSNTVE